MIDQFEQAVNNWIAQDDGIEANQKIWQVAQTIMLAAGGFSPLNWHSLAACDDEEIRDAVQSAALSVLNGTSRDQRFAEPESKVINAIAWMMIIRRADFLNCVIEMLQTLPKFSAN